MNVTCSATNVCTTILNSSCVYYTGDDLIYTGILTNDNLTAALEKINAKFQDAGLGYVFQNGITQATPGAPVKLGGVLTGDTVITSDGFDLTITENLIVGSVAISGGLPTQFLKADGSLDSTTYQVAGDYITDLTGDGTASGPGSAAFTLATVNLGPGTYGNATHVPVVTVNAKGLVTSVTTTAINLPPTLASFSGDVTGIGNINVPITLTLNTVNSNVYGSNTFLRFAVNSKGLVTSATPVTAGTIYGVLGYVPVPDTRTITINGTTYDLSANRSWTINSLPVQVGHAGQWLKTNGSVASWQTLSGNVSLFTNDAGYLTAIPTLQQVVAAGNSTTSDIFVNSVESAGGAKLEQNGEVSTTGVNFITNGGFLQDGVTTSPRIWNLPDNDGVLAMSVNGIAADDTGNVTLVVGAGTVTEVDTASTVPGLSLLGGPITNTGTITLSGSIILDSSQVTTALGYVPYNATNPNGFITTSALSPYITTATANSTFYLASNPNGYITRAGISGSGTVQYNTNTGVISVASGYSIPLTLSQGLWNQAYIYRIVFITNNGNSGPATINYSTNTLNVPEYTLAGLGGVSSTYFTGSAPISYNSGTGVISHSTADGYLHVPATGTTNNGKFLIAGATAGSFSWATYAPRLKDILANGTDVLPDDNNYQGNQAGSGATGANNNFFGAGAGQGNTGSLNNAFGTTALYNNTGTSVNAMGSRAGSGNTFNNVNIFGYASSTGGIILPTTKNQTVLIGDTYAARLSYNFLTGTRTHILPDENGTYVMSVNGYTADNRGGVSIPYVSSVSGTGTVSGLTLTGTVNYSNPAGNLTLGGTLTLTSGQITTALGFTPYNATNPNSYISRTGISSSATGLTYTSGTGVFSLTAGYSIPLTASQTNWDVAYSNRITNLTTTGSSGAAQLSGNVLNIPTPTITGLGGVPTTRTISINGGPAQPLSSDVNLTVAVGTGTVTSVSASVPSAFNVNVTNPTSTPAIAITGAGNSSQYINGFGQLAPLPLPSAGGGSNVVYYMNGSVASSVVGYQQFSKDAVVGIGTNFPLTNTTGYIAKFLTVANDPGLLSIPSGTWEFDINFSSSNGTGTPTFYVELCKYDGTFTTIGTSNTVTISSGVTNTTYTATISLTSTPLTLTDRLAVRVYVNTDGNRTITMYTEGSYLAQAITTFARGITALNSLTAQVQSFSTGASGSAFTISSSSSTHTFTIPDASGTSGGMLTATTQIIGGDKTFNSPIIGSIKNITGGSAGSIPYQSASSTTLFVSPGTTGQALISNGTSAPAFGTLGISGGGTGNTTFTLGKLIKYNGTSFVDATSGQDYLAPNSAITGATNTKITYDSKGLVTGGSQASAGDLSNGTTGTGGAIVLANTPTLITPNIGAATGTSLSVTGQLTSTVAIGTAPFTVASTTQVNNLTAEFATKTSNINGGSAGAVVYQTGAGNTSFSGTAIAPGIPLLSGGLSGTGQPSYAVLGFAGGGTGQTTQQAAINALVGSTTSGTFLRGDGTNVTMSTLLSSDIPDNNANTGGTAAGLSGNQAINTVYAGPSSGSPDVAQFRALVPADIPILNQSTTQSAGSVSGTNVISNDNLRQSVARSVIGVTGNATANVADIQSSVADQVLISTANSIGWGKITNDSINTNVIGLDKIVQISGPNFLGRLSGTGNIEVLSQETATSMLKVFDYTASKKGLVPAPANTDNTKFLRGDGSWQPVVTSYTVLPPISTNTSITATSGEVIALVSNASNAVTVTIPNAVGNNAKITIKKTSSATNFNLTVNTGGGNIDGGSSIDLTLATQYTSVTLISDGSNWYII